MVGDAAKATVVRVGGRHSQYLGARRRVTADAGGVALGVEHRRIVVEVLNVNVHKGVCAEASLPSQEPENNNFFIFEVTKLCIQLHV